MICINILVTGASGFLGTKIMSILKGDFNIIGTDRDESRGNSKMDITDANEVSSMIHKIKPDVVLHLAALADVDKCETDRYSARKINVEGTRNLIEACKKTNSKFIFISTDFVFDGKKGNYKEEDKPNPLSYYGVTKLEAEKLVEKSGLKYLILRLEVLYGFNGNGSERSFTMWVFNSLKQGKEIKVLDDQFSTPTLTDDIANAIKLLVNQKKEGLYHVCGSQRLSKYDMAVKLAEVFNFDRLLIKPMKTSDFKQAAARPKDSSMIIEKLKKEGIKMHSFEEGLQIMKKQMFINL